MPLYLGENTGFRYRPFRAEVRFTAAPWQCAVSASGQLLRRTLDTSRFLLRHASRMALVPQPINVMSLGREIA
jgi:hypothetical protein